MRYYSLQHSSGPVDFRTATREGQAPDKGLYFPENIPGMPETFIDTLPARSLIDIGTAVMAPFTEGDIPEPILRDLLREVLSFDIPLVRLSDDLYVLELFHGPTLAFKDVGARFMIRCMGYFAGEGARQSASQGSGAAQSASAQPPSQGAGTAQPASAQPPSQGAGTAQPASPDARSGPVTVLVATSGDTGGAVASGFDGVEGVRVVILYPKGKVSPVQELQLTTCGDNVVALEIEGTFDDCQRMVKEAFGDTELQRHLRLTSANSINVARWLPQSMYYWWAYRQWDHSEAPVFVVPSGNFGNICAGLLAYHMGLPARHFLAACNANDTIPRYMRTGEMQPKLPVATLSNAMDVAVPSNFGRILELFARKGASLDSKVSSFSLDDAETQKAMRELYREYGYVADPHTAVGYGAWLSYRSANPGAKGILLSTAHPVKFAPTIEATLGITLELPAEVQALSGKIARKIAMGPDFSALKAYLLK
jgi:threonine synthase